MHIYTYAYIYIYIQINVFTYMHTCIYRYIYIYTTICICLHMYLQIYNHHMHPNDLWFIHGCFFQHACFPTADLTEPLPPQESGPCPHPVQVPSPWWGRASHWITPHRLQPVHSKYQMMTGARCFIFCKNPLASNFTHRICIGFVHINYAWQTRHRCFFLVGQMVQ